MHRIKRFVSRDGRRRSALDEILGHIRTHFVGRVVTLAAATALSALLSVALLPLTTQHLQASDNGTYGLLMSIVALVGAAAECVRLWHQKLRRSAITDLEHFRLTREHFRRSAPRDGARTWSVVSAQTSVT
jgi:hypothetical protein